MPDVLLWAHSRSPSGDILTLSKGKEEASEKDAERGEGNLKTNSREGSARHTQCPRIFNETY